MSLLPMQQSIQYGDSIRQRSCEHAITFAGDEATPPFPIVFSSSLVSFPPVEWLFCDMFNKSDSSPTMLSNLQISRKEWQLTGTGAQVKQ
jgi:hypothetical protein